MRMWATRVLDTSWYHTFRDRVSDLYCCLVVERTGCKGEEELKTERDEEIDGIVWSVAVDGDCKPEGQQGS